MAVALPSQSKWTHMTSCLPICVHDFPITDVVSDEVTAASNDFYRFELPFKDIRSSEVHILNHRSQLYSHLYQLGLLRMRLG